MSIQKLVEIVHDFDLTRAARGTWPELNKIAFESLFGSPEGRYPARARGAAALRSPEMSQDSGVPFAGYIHQSNPASGAYSGLSFVMFPVPGAPALIGMVVGTQGLSPDEGILGRPGHARKMIAVADWLNHAFGDGAHVAWAKQDPTRTDVSVPDALTRTEGWQQYKSVFDRYGREMYALYRPTSNREATRNALIAFLDLFFEERGFTPLTPHTENAKEIQSAWFDHLMPRMEAREISDLLNHRRFVIVQGPPGTGKTMTARQLLRDEYGGNGITIQFHPNTTYESFVGGLAPAAATGALGLRFEPTPGFLMRAAARALDDPARKFLLHVDEINRADLSKVLGEAIFLLEPMDPSRTIELPFDFGPPFHRTLCIPPNLHILGTMNSADRSIAIVDVALRRRFAFVSLWPQMSVVNEYGAELMKQQFSRLTSIFIDHAADDAFPLVPGHSYFLEGDPALAKHSLRTNLAPLLEEYLAQGYVSGFAEAIRTFLQGLRAL